MEARLTYKAESLILTGIFKGERKTDLRNKKYFTPEEQIQLSGSICSPLKHQLPFQKVVCKANIYPIISSTENYKFQKLITEKKKISSHETVFKQIHFQPFTPYCLGQKEIIMKVLEENLKTAIRILAFLQCFIISKDHLHTFFHSFDSQKKFQIISIIVLILGNSASTLKVTSFANQWTFYAF